MGYSIVIPDSRGIVIFVAMMVFVFLLGFFLGKLSSLRGFISELDVIRSKTDSFLIKMYDIDLGMIDDIESYFKGKIDLSSRKEQIRELIEQVQSH